MCNAGDTHNLPKRHVFSEVQLRTLRCAIPGTRTWAHRARLNDVQGATWKTDTTSTTEELLWRRQKSHPQQAPAILGNDNSPLHASLALKAPVALQGYVKRPAAEADTVQLMRNYVAQSSARLATTVVCAATCSHPAGLPCWKRQREHTRVVSQPAANPTSGNIQESAAMGYTVVGPSHHCNGGIEVSTLLRMALYSCLPLRLWKPCGGDLREVDDHAQTHQRKARPSFQLASRHGCIPSTCPKRPKRGRPAPCSATAVRPHPPPHPPPRFGVQTALVGRVIATRSENGRKAPANDIHPPSFDCWCMSETTAQLPLFDSHRSATVRHPFGQYTDDCLVMNAALALEPAFAPLSTLAHTSCLSSAIMGKCPMVLTLRSSPQEATWTAGSGAARGGLDPSCTGRRAQAPLCAHTRNTLKPGHGGMR